MPLKHHLILFFNEDYSRNIPLLGRVYGSRFSRISYVAPDHYGRLDPWYHHSGKSYRLAHGLDVVVNKARRWLGRTNPHELAGRSRLENVASVIGYKLYFQDFFWQARAMLLRSNADWFWFAADDLLLNPIINEANILDFFKAPDRSRSVLCKPCFQSDVWINWFQGSSAAVIGKLRRVNAYPQDRRSLWFLDDHDMKGADQGRVVGGCADFFGCHRELLPAILPLFHALAVNKVFVEMAIPNALLTYDEAPTLIPSFHWEFGAGRGGAEKIESFIRQPGDTAFYHPVKFGMLERAVVERILSACAPV